MNLVYDCALYVYNYKSTHDRLIRPITSFSGFQISKPMLEVAYNEKWAWGSWPCPFSLVLHMVDTQASA